MSDGFHLCSITFPARFPGWFLLLQVLTDHCFQNYDFLPLVPTDRCCPNCCLLLLVPMWNHCPKSERLPDLTEQKSHL